MQADNNNSRGSSEEPPQLPWGTRFDDAELADLLERYTTWQAPWLLSLPGLDDPLREDLEHRAAKNARAIAQLWHIYPKIIDTTRLKAALVEARLRSSCEPPGDI